MFVQEKVPGGKLLCVEAEFSGDRIEKIRITGDFFLHPEETIDSIEKGLVGVKADRVAAKVSEVLARFDARLLGASPEDIERLVRRALP
jgi:lipoate-protein ligase A